MPRRICSAFSRPATFPIAASSRTYALQYAAFGVAGGLSPVWIGYLADLTGGYYAALLTAAVALAVPVAALTTEERSRGVVGVSSGNHAQGVAWAAKRLGIAATIVMPNDAPYFVCLPE